MDIKHEEKIDKYVDLTVEIKELGKMKSAKVVPVVIGELGTIPKRLKVYLRNINVGIDLVHFKEQSCWDQQGSSEESLKLEAAFCDLIYIYIYIYMMGLKFPTLTYLP